MNQWGIEYYTTDNLKMARGMGEEYSRQLKDFFKGNLSRVIWKVLDSLCGKKERRILGSSSAVKNTGKEKFTPKTNL